MRLLAALLLATACTTPRTEVVIGIATDMPVTMMDEMTLKVFREGVLEFEVPNPWRIQGPASGDFELPAIFGVYSDDGSEPKITVEIDGSLGGNIVIVRRAIFTLRKEQTLYMRMALLKSCKSVWMSCENADQTQTCIEGACQPADIIDVLHFNPYAGGEEKVIQCSGGPTLVDTKTTQPLPNGPAAASCGTCIESACYK